MTDKKKSIQHNHIMHTQTSEVTNTPIHQHTDTVVVITMIIE